MQARQITISNKLGLHARAANKFVSLAKTFACTVRVDNDGEEVDGKRIMSVMLLAATLGTELTINTEGVDEEAAIQALCELIEDRFGEDE